MLRGPAYRVETPRLRLRCFRPDDAQLWHAAIAENLEHLRPWMGWTAHEPVPFEQRLESLRTRRGHFDLGSDYHFLILDKAESRVLGSAGLTLHGAVDERDLGYWIRADMLGQGLASEAAAALVRVGFDVEALQTLEIRMEVHNERSARVAQKLGFAGPVLDPLSYPTPEGDKRDMHVYSLSRVAYASSALRATPIEAYDVLERRLL